MKKGRIKDKEKSQIGCVDYPIFNENWVLVKIIMASLFTEYNPLLKVVRLSVLGSTIGPLFVGNKFMFWADSNLSEIHNRF